MRLVSRAEWREGQASCNGDGGGLGPARRSQPRGARRRAPETPHYEQAEPPRARQAHASGAPRDHSRWAPADETGPEGHVVSPDPSSSPPPSKADANSWWTPSLNIRAADIWATTSDLPFSAQHYCQQGWASRCLGRSLMLSALGRCCPLLDSRGAASG